MKSTKLIGKVLIGFLLTAAVLSVAILFMYRSIYDVSIAVEEAGKPNERLEEWKSAVNLLYEAENSARSWRVTKNQEDLTAFDSIRSAQAMHIIKLYELNRDSVKGLAYCDSLRLLSAERFEVLGDWINFSFIENEEHSVLDDILLEMARREKTVSEKNSQQMAAREEPLSSEGQNIVVSAEKEKSFWQRLIRKNKRTYMPIAIAAFDSTKQTDSLIPVVETKEIRKTIQTGQIRIESRADSVLREESRLLKADQQIMSRIHNVSDLYEKLCGKENAEKLKAASNAASEGTRSMTRWTIVTAICIILFSVFFISRDIIRNRKLQAQLLVAKENAERLAKTKEDFMANMSHEIRNPLNVISGFSAQLLKGNLDVKNKKQAEGIYRSSEFLIALVNDILDISKVKSGKLQLEKIPFPLAEIRADLENAFGLRAREKGLLFSVEISPTLPPVIMGDPVRFRQVLFNLVSNAVKFTDEGFIAIRFDEKVQPDHTKKLLIRISDSGIGIAKDKINTIFEEFEQADATITRKYGGTGLGLSITRVLISEMNGTITTESQPGKGSTFIIYLPLAAGESKIVLSDDQPAFDKTLLIGKSILICDDEPMNRMLASHLVKTYEGIVKECCGGKETLEILSKEKIDLILLDLEMPDMSGEETIELIRKAEEKTGNKIRIIAVTGRSRDKVSVNKITSADGYVQKPYKENDMLMEISRVLALRPD
ncbi:MAG: ATP-binding protein [Bacteroidota bacterium]|nr:ATP-binding protein [Bacteroidota bacterium]